jgi:hypothetical protein
MTPRFCSVACPVSALLACAGTVFFRLAENFADERFAIPAGRDYLIHVGKRGVEYAQAQLDAFDRARWRRSDSILGQG